MDLVPPAVSTCWHGTPSASVIKGPLRGTEGSHFRVREREVWTCSYFTAAADTDTFLFECAFGGLL